jgi:hypothetical protein
MITCFECGAEFSEVPPDFIHYDRYHDRWVTPAEEDDTCLLPDSGTCKPCQDQIEATRDIYGGRGTENIERRTIEDEMWVWER